MTPVKCFLITPTDQADRFLRRYEKHSDDRAKCEVCEHEYHQVSVLIGRFPVLLGQPDESGNHYQRSPDVSKYKGDKRWPKEAPCGYKFLPDDERQVYTETVYTDEVGNEYSLRKPVPGMMYESWWYSDTMKGDDGKAYIVILPDLHPWSIDGRAKNCTKPDEWTHRCWIRHGTPPVLTVDKNGNTCGAGAGSIQTPKFHGFLRDGYLVVA